MRAAVAMANRRSALLRFRRKREARTFDKKVTAVLAAKPLNHFACLCLGPHLYRHFAKLSPSARTSPSHSVMMM